MKKPRKKRLRSNIGFKNVKRHIKVKCKCILEISEHQQDGAIEALLDNNIVYIEARPGRKYQETFVLTPLGQDVTLTVVRKFQIIELVDWLGQQGFEDANQLQVFWDLLFSQLSKMLTDAGFINVDMNRQKLGVAYTVYSKTGPLPNIAASWALIPEFARKQLLTILESGHHYADEQMQTIGFRLLAALKMPPRDGTAIRFDL